MGIPKIVAGDFKCATEKRNAVACADHLAYIIIIKSKSKQKCTGVLLLDGYFPDVIPNRKVFYL